jgi:hypothetical protein
MKTFTGQLQIDENRGVIYFHLTDPKEIEYLGMVTILRICNLPKPIPVPQNKDDWTQLHGAWDINVGKDCVCTWKGLDVNGTEKGKPK